MKRIRHHFSMLAASILFTGMGMAAVASATPAPNDVVVIDRYFNDCVITTLNITENYPVLIDVEEGNLQCVGGANMHLWNLSEDGGLTSAVFNNADGFRLKTTLTLTSNAVGTEAGLRVSPWWDQNANGYFNVRLPDGEIACFGGVLPFFTFTGAFGLHYAAGNPIGLEVVYQPHCNTELNKGTIEYRVYYEGNVYTSGPLEFGNCTPGEEIHGCYGIMDNARVGGRVQNNHFAGGGDASYINDAKFEATEFEAVSTDCPVQNEGSSWGRVKGIYR